jgi:hypothetical protein
LRHSIYASTFVPSKKTTIIEGLKITDMKRYFLLLYIFLIGQVVVLQSQTIQVWPGDANNNGVVNNLDFLYLGLGYNYFGSARDSINVNWSAQTAQPWSLLLSSASSNFPNLAYTDCNGDGIVNYNYDAFPIYVHYGLTHDTVNQEIFIQGLPGIDPKLELDSSALPVTVQSGQQLSLPIVLGSSELPVNDLYGLAFTVFLDPDFVDADQVQVSFNETSWANPDNDRIFSVYRVSPERLDVAWVRTDHNDRNGFGKMGKFNFIVIDDVVDLQSQFNIRIENIKMIDKYGNESTAEGDTLTITVQPDALLDDDNLRNNQFLHIYPNPAKEQINVDSKQNIEQLALINTLGQRVLTVFPQQLKTVLDVSGLSSGIYLLEVHSEQGVRLEKIQINR